MSSFESRPFPAGPARTFIDRAGAAAPAFVETPFARAAPHTASDDFEATTSFAASLEQAGDTEREQGLVDAYERGRAEGAREAEARHAVEVRAALDALAVGVAAASTRAEGALSLLAGRALALAAEIAERILKRSVADDLAALVPCVEEALAALAPDAPVTLALAPDDLARLHAGEASALAQLAERMGIALRPEPRLARGEAELASGPACVELRWNTLVARLRAALEAQSPAVEAMP